MNTAESQHIGIDLTQHKPILAIAHGRQVLETRTLADTPPQVLLPVVSGESVLAGAVAHEHRRGMGSLWPPECQVPVYGDPVNGVGRIPLVCAWAKFLKSNKEGFSGITGDTDISWRPPGGNEIFVPAERLIADSVKEWTKDFVQEKIAIIVPDSFNEAAQQALLDNCNGFLVPRPIGIALAWCRRNAEVYQGLGEDNEEGVPIGHILVITMALDQWEIVPIEIRARKFRNNTWLIPVRTWTYNIGALPRFGIGVLTGMTNPEIEDTNEIWRRCFSLGKSATLFDGNKVIGQKELRALRECLKRGFSTRDRKLFGQLSIWSDIISNSLDLSITELGNEISEIYEKQLKFLHSSAANKCLAVVVDGACANVRVSEERLLANVLISQFKNTNIEIGNGFSAAQGAAYTIAAMRQNLPSYRETIVPIEIHHHRRNEKGDLENAWKMLIEGTTVKAGDEYKTRENEPIKGLQIRENDKALKLTLRRPSIDGGEVFREITTEVPEKAKENEPVEISVRLRPGQGFAKITIESERKGFFRTLLNWRNMKPCDPPPPPPLSYLPEVSRVKQHTELWDAAEPFLHLAIDAFRINDPNLRRKLDSLREHINQWPLADKFDEFRGRPRKGGLFLHYGVFPSDGEINGGPQQKLTAEFISQVEDYFLRRTGFSPRTKESVQWTASWLYMACPPSIIHSVRRKLEMGFQSVKREDLHTIGLCFEEPKDIELFFKAFESRIQTGLAGTNNWLRASRNIVRFRDHSLRPEIVKRNSLENIFNGLVLILEEQISQHNFAMIFDNCVLSCLYFLKRRRYESDFLASNTKKYVRLESMLRRLLDKEDNSLNDRRFRIVQTTLKFIRSQGTLEDFGTIIEE